MTAPDFYRILFTTLFVGMWVGWFILWRVMAARMKATASRESWSSRLSHYIPLIIAAGLIAPVLPIPVLDQRFVPRGLWPPTLGVIVAYAGLAICVWARFTIADNWSGVVEVKQGHELVVDGPYKWVRHPIYTGLLLMFVGTALAIGEWRGVLAVALVVAAFWRKLKIEEGVMRATFGAAYDRYAERTPALIPFVI